MNNIIAKTKTYSFYLDWHSSIEQVDAKTKKEAVDILEKKVLDDWERYQPRSFEIHFDEVVE